MLSKELVAASAEPLILSLLSKGESYGYAIIQEVRKLSEDQIQWTDGMLYPVLHRLETQSGALVMQDPSYPRRTPHDQLLQRSARPRA